MFSHHKSDYKALRKNVLSLIATTLKELREHDERLADSQTYLFLQELKGRLFDKSISLSFVLQACKAFQANTSELHNERLLNAVERLTTPLLKNENALKASPESDAKTTEDILKRYINIARKKTIVDSLYYQCTNLMDPKVTKDEMLKILLYLGPEETALNCKFISINDIDVGHNQTGAIGIQSQPVTAEKIYMQRSIALFKMMEQMLETCASSGHHRMQFILREGVHYYTLDINTQTSSCILLDAASDTRKLRIHQLPVHIRNINIVYDAEDTLGVLIGHSQTKTYKLQMDESSCIFFAIDHARNAAKITNLHEMIQSAKQERNKRSEHVYTTDWTNFPPRMIKNSQSSGYLNACIERYRERNPAHADELLTLTNQNERGYALKAVQSDALKFIDYICKYNNPDEIVKRITDTESSNELKRGRK